MNDIYIINTHSHVNMLRETNIDEAIQNAIDNKIVTIVPSSSAQDIFDTDKFIKKYNDVYGYVGVFPEEVKDFSDKTLSDMEEIIKSNPKIIGIGEIGLDYYWDKSFKELQKEVFAKQIRLANELSLPIAVHDREAHKDTFDIIKSENKGSDVLFHCFSGSVEFMKECVKQGWYIALGGVVTFKNAVKMKDVAKEVPLEKLVLETDSPYLTPVPYRGKTNYPAYVKFVAEEIANLRAMPVEELIGITTENAERLFKI